MEAAWAISRLEQFQRACQHWHQSDVNRRYEGGDPDLYAEVLRLEPTAKRILAEGVPELEEINVRMMAGAIDAVHIVQAALGALSVAEEVAEQFGPTGPVSVLLTCIWQAAATFWDGGRHAVAVEQAAKSLVAHAQQIGLLPHRPRADGRRALT